MKALVSPDQILRIVLSKQREYPEEFSSHPSPYNLFCPLIATRERFDKDAMSPEHPVHLLRGYFSGLSAIGFSFGESLGGDGKPLVKPHACRTQVKALVDFWTILGPSLYLDFVELTGFFSGCRLYRMNDIAKSLRLPVDVSTGLAVLPDSFEVGDGVEQLGGRPREMFTHALKNYIAVNTEVIPELGFPNPWRQVAHGKIQDDTLRNVRNCHLSPAFRDAFAGVGSGKKDSPQSKQWFRLPKLEREPSDDYYWTKEKSFLEKHGIGRTKYRECLPEMASKRKRWITGVKGIHGIYVKRSKEQEIVTLCRPKSQ